MFEEFQKGVGLHYSPMMPREGSVLSDAVRLIVAVFLRLNFRGRLSTNENNSELVRLHFADYMMFFFSGNTNFMIKKIEHQFEKKNTE